MGIVIVRKPVRNGTGTRGAPSVPFTRAAFLLAVLLLLPRPSLAVTISVPLPSSLLGPYEYRGESKSFVLDLGVEFASIESIEISLEGTASAGQWSCVVLGTGESCSAIITSLPTFLVGLDLGESPSGSNRASFAAIPTESDSFSASRAFPGSQWGDALSGRFPLSIGLQQVTLPSGSTRHQSHAFSWNVLLILGPLEAEPEGALTGGTFTVTGVLVPEPSSALMVLVGLAATALWRRMA
jgi:hypothetical protein